MPKIQFEVNVTNDVSIDVDNDVLPLYCMKVYPFRFNQSNSQLQAALKS